MTNNYIIGKSVGTLFLTCILVFMLEKDKFSLAQVQVTYLGKVGNAEVIIQEMT